MNRKETCKCLVLVRGKLASQPSSVPQQLKNQQTDSFHRLSGKSKSNILRILFFKLDILMLKYENLFKIEILTGKFYNASVFQKKNIQRDSKRDSESDKL